MDRNIIAINHHYANGEAAVAIACYSAAAHNGLSNSQADACDDGNKACPACPFNDSKHTEQPLNPHHNYVFASGAMDALKPDFGDRRFFVVDRAAQEGV